MTALLRQEVTMNVVKRERWTEAEVLALPTGEHDYFERKSGLLFNNEGDLLGKLAKTISALANSGGGHILLGVDDAGGLDGVPPTKGRAAIRDWLEQKITNLVDYPLADFRVHVVERSDPSQIPPDREVVVIAVGDSALAPHQCAHDGGSARKYTYYHRQAGRSEPAPHFYLELLRQRLVSPVLEVRGVELIPTRARRIDGAVFLATELRFRVENTGRVAAYKWAVQVREMGGHPKERPEDYRWNKSDYPDGMGNNISLAIDDTILPGGVRNETSDFGCLLRPKHDTAEALQAEVERMICSVSIGYRVATETSLGDMQYVAVGSLVAPQDLTAFVVQAL
ncbi:MAG: ATP-binding protein [Chloroflexia bacterium]|nr:ATP-binding protein [Chloroflexia bacterium]